ncbi:hypothetical protein HUX53_08310 [Actinomadura sp. BRA 177]|nr:hypothetical protein [Actinomadura sp. BRA 177]
MLLRVRRGGRHLPRLQRGEGLGIRIGLLTPPSGPVARIVHITGLNRTIPTTTDRTEARAALLRLRSSVYQGVAVGDVRDDVGLDLTNVIESMLDRQWSPLDRRRADVAYLQHKISTRTREGGITGGRSRQLHRILDNATG